MIIAKGGSVSDFTNFQTQEVISTITPWYSFIDPKLDQIFRRVKKLHGIFYTVCIILSVEP